jgi:iron(III) transport system permease protein
MSDIYEAAVLSLPRTGRRRRDWSAWLAVGLSGAVLAVFLVYPIAKTVLLAFTAQDAAPGLGALTLANFRNFLDAPIFREALLHTLAVGLATTLLSVVIAVPAAYAVARVGVPLRGFLTSLSVVPLISPPFIGGYAWIVLLGNRGIVTRYAEKLFGLHLPSIYGPAGITLALTLSFFPFVFLLAQGALAASDPYLEESAHIMGASRLRIAATVTLPLVLPAIASGALLVFAHTLGNFGVPSVLGKDYTMLSTLLMYQLQGTFDVNNAAAIALINVAITAIGMVALSRFSAGRRFITVTSTSRAASRRAGRGLRFAGAAYVWALCLVGVLPQAVILMYSFAERWPGTLWPTRWGFGNYAYVFQQLVEPMLNSLILSGAATLLCVVFGVLAAYAASRRGLAGKSLLDATIMLPFIMPGIITGVAFIASFGSGWLVLTGTGTILVMAYFVRRLAYTFRAVSSALSQLDGRIAEASTICGAGWLYTMRRVVIPLVAPGILAGAILVFATLIMDLNITILLYSANWRTMAIVMYQQLFDDKVGYASATASVAIVVTTVLVFGASRLVGRTMADMFR